MFINQVTSTHGSKITCGVEILPVLHFSHDFIILFSEHSIHTFRCDANEHKLGPGPFIFRLAVWIHRKFISGAFRWWNSMCWNMICWKQDVNRQTPEAMLNHLWTRMEYERDMRWSLSHWFYAFAVMSTLAVRLVCNDVTIIAWFISFYFCRPCRKLQSTPDSNHLRILFSAQQLEFPTIVPSTIELYEVTFRDRKVCSNMGQ